MVRQIALILLVFLPKSQEGFWCVWRPAPLSEFWPDLAAAVSGKAGAAGLPVSDHVPRAHRDDLRAQAPC